jgi:hypothetical protein
MSLIHSEPNLFHIFKSCHAWLFKETIFSVANGDYTGLRRQDSSVGLGIGSSPT